MPGARVAGLLYLNVKLILTERENLSIVILAEFCYSFQRCRLYFCMRVSCGNATFERATRAASPGIRRLDMLKYYREFN